MISRTNTVTFDGILAKEVDVQVTITKGLPSFNIVGLADKSVSESKERLRSAFQTIGYGLPASRITVNLSPADLSKEGSHFDLPIALAILGAANIIPREEIINFIALGEIALDGRIVPVSGILSASYFASQNNKGIIIPESQMQETILVKNSIEILPINNLLQIVNYFAKGVKLNVTEPATYSDSINENTFTDIANIKGHESAKRVLGIAAAGKHNLLMIGPPGSGKSMLANALGGILPPLTREEALEVNLIYSVAGVLKDSPIITKRPYRAPHHSASLPSLIGGGSKAKAGEITLAHNGVLFLDELAEFNRNILDALRQPIETGSVNIARVNAHVTYPANFQLIAAMNPCRCGYFGEDDRSCSKAPACAEQYQNKISGPILDRIDLIIEVPQVKLHEIDAPSDKSITEKIRQSIYEAREIQFKRYKQYKILTNSEATSEILEETANLSTPAKEILKKSAEKFKFSTRAYYRVIKTARTIADLDKSPNINNTHISEAINYRKVSYYHKLLEKNY